MAAGRRAGPYAAAAPVALLTLLAFAPMFGFPFLNWDDQDVFVRNDALRADGVVAWAFTTRFMEHYQPLAWLTWAAVDRTIGLTPAAAHGLNVVMHALCAAIVCLLTWRLASSKAHHGPAKAGHYNDSQHGPAKAGHYNDSEHGPAKAGHYNDSDHGPAEAAHYIGALAALVWALHPLRVEPVAWASAMPYSLALLFALLATIAWFDGRAWTAAILVGLSLLSRPLALALPVILWLIRRPTTTRERLALLFAAAGVAATAAAESSARLTATLAEVGPGARLTLAATAAWRYLWRTIWPARLTPLDPLALAPQTDMLAIALGLGGIVLVSAAAWRWRQKAPALAGAWAAYLLLLVPAMGLVPSGLQATADRYSYMPGVALSLALAAVLSRTARRAGVLGAAVIAVAAVATLAALTWQQTGYWRDSTTLWTRAVEIDARNDVALYNLGAALAEAGRRDEAIARYDQALAIVPRNEPARRNRDLLVAARLEEEGNRLASNRDLAGAIERYGAAVKLDAQRTHAQAALGMALFESGRPDDARPHLQAALDQNVNDPAVPNALAYALVLAGDEEAAIAVLRAARRRFPGDANIARNLEGLEKKKGGP
jgi:tetratricopeptide (TPR) repeat protein